MTMSVSTQDTSDETATSAHTKWVIALFFVSIFIPGAFNVGFSLNPYRIFLIVAAFPTLRQIVRDPTLRLTGVDVLVFLGIAWRSLAVLVNNGADGAVFSIALMIDLGSAMRSAGRSFGKLRTSAFSSDASCCCCWPSCRSPSWSL
ncbi:hypothetical protein CNY89_16350 [Amaricoccus sp. HAR-UPW-R2A-40]|nr:hypothetical protein CNY89_16350 [Amaricoccus sp. HAR-UPW-R2A-40]